MITNEQIKALAVARGFKLNARISPEEWDLRAYVYEFSRDLIAEVLRPYKTLRLLDDYHEDYGNVLWWVLPVCEPPYCGTPNDSDWPGYHTHWTTLLEPHDEGANNG